MSDLTPNMKTGLLEMLEGTGGDTGKPLSVPAALHPTLRALQRRKLVRLYPLDARGKNRRYCVYLTEEGVEVSQGLRETA